MGCKLLALALGVWMGAASVVRMAADTTCTRKSQEYAVSLHAQDFKTRTEAIQEFRDMLELIEDEVDWFSHSKDEGRHFVQMAQYLELPNKNLFSDHSLEFRYRRNTHFHKVNKSDFVVKFKNPSDFTLAPMTASSDWSTYAQCKVERNFNYVGCKDKSCFPSRECYDDCGNPGLSLTFEEQVAKVKGDADEPFGEDYTAGSQIDDLGKIDDFFPDIVGHFELGSAATVLSVDRTQHRYIYEKVKLKLNGTKIESEFTLLYTEEEHAVTDKIAAPNAGKWSFKLESDEFELIHLAELLTEMVGKRYNPTPPSTTPPSTTPPSTTTPSSLSVQFSPLMVLTLACLSVNLQWFFF